jgi:hypothetical protein
MSSLSQLKRSVAKSVAIKAATHGSSIEATNAAVAIKVIEELAMHGSVRKAASECGVDKKTVARICRDHKAVLGDWREYAAGESFLLKQRSQALLHRKMDMMEDDDEQVKKTNIRDLAQAASMMGESYMAAMGEGPKALVVNVGPSIEDVQKHLEDIKAKIAASVAERRAQAINV